MIRIAGLAAALLCAASGDAHADWRVACRFDNYRTADELRAAFGVGGVYLGSDSGSDATIGYDFGDGTGMIVKYISDRGSLVAWTGHYTGTEEYSQDACRRIRRQYWSGDDGARRCHFDVDENGQRIVCEGGAQ